MSYGRHLVRTACVLREMLYLARTACTSPEPPCLLRLASAAVKYELGSKADVCSPAKNQSIFLTTITLNSEGFWCSPITLLLRLNLVVSVVPFFYLFSFPKLYSNTARL